MLKHKHKHIHKHIIRTWNTGEYERTKHARSLLGHCDPWHFTVWITGHISVQACSWSAEILSMFCGWKWQFITARCWFADPHGDEDVRCTVLAQVLSPFLFIVLTTDPAMRSRRISQSPLTCSKPGIQRWLRCQWDLGKTKYIYIFFFCCKNPSKTFVQIVWGQYGI